MPAPQQEVEALEVPTQAEMEKSTSNREAAALEEKLAYEQVSQARMAGQDAEQLKSEPEPLVSIAAQGREHLMQKLREHAEATANKPVYVPPPRTERQMSQLERELEAGRAAQRKHQAQEDSRPVPKVDHVKEGFTTPTYRPGSAVPDPTKGDGPGVANSKGTFSPTA